MLTSFNALDIAQQKTLLSSKLLTEEQKSQCATMVALSSVNSKYTAEQLTRVAGVSAETLANWGLVDSTDSLTIAELAELAVSDKQAKNILDKIIAQNAQAVANGEVTASNIALASSEGGATLATDAFTTAIKTNISAMWTWITTTPLGWLTLLVAGVFAATKVYNAFTVSVEEQKEKMEESLSAYEDAKSELSSITTELERQEQAMDALLAKEKLTYAEKGQLEKLQAITKELRIQKDLAEKEKDRTEKQLAKDAVDLFDKQFGDYEISEQAINEYQSNADITGNNADITGNNVILISDENDISAMIASYKQFNELLNEAYDSGSQDDIDYLKASIEDLEDNIFTTTHDLQTQQSNISAYYESIKDTPYEDFTAEQKEIVDTYNAISNAIALIYQHLDPNTWNSMQIDGIFDTEGIEKTKEELVAMAHSGELTPETIKGYTNLNNALGETTLSAEDLCNELYAIADEQNSTLDDELDGLWTISKAQSEAMDNYTSRLSTLQEMLEKLSSDTMTDSELMNYLKEFPELADDTDNFTGAVQSLILAEKDSALALMSDAPDSYKRAIQGAADEALHFAGNVNKLQLEMFNLENILKRVQTSDSLSEAEITSLINKYDALSDAVIVLADGSYSLEEDAVIDLLNTTITSSNGAISAQIKTTEETIKAINQRISAYAAEAKALIALNSTMKGAMGQLYSNKYQNMSTDEILRTDEGRQDLIAEYGEEAVLAYERWQDNKLILELTEEELVQLKYALKDTVQIGQKYSKDAENSAEDASEAIKNYADAYMNYMKASLDAGKIDYHTYSIDVSNFLKDMFDQGKLSARDYFSYTKQMLEVQKDIYDSVISAVTHRIEEEIEIYEKQIDSIEEKYNSEIEYLDTIIAYYEEQKAALQDTNDEMDRQLALEQALYHFEQASSQKTQKVYTASDGYIYKADEGAIKDASDELRQAQLDMEIAKLEEAIEQVEAQQATLEQAMEKEKEQLQEIIDRLQEYSDQWSEVAEQYEIQQNILHAQQLLGADWEQQILAGRLDTLNDFKNSYIAIQQAIAEATWNGEQAQYESAGKAVNHNEEDDSTPKTRYGVVDEATGDVMPDEIYDSRDKAQQRAEALNAAYHNENDPDSTFYYVRTITTASKGGVLSAQKPSPLAGLFGEDIIVAAQNGERILTPAQNQMWEQWTAALPNLQNLSASLIQVNLPDFSHLTTLPQPQLNTTPVVQNINLTLPNITNHSGYERLQKELRQMQLDALQLAHRR